MSNPAKSSRIKGDGIQSIAAGAKRVVQPKDRGQYCAQFVVSNLTAAGTANSIIYVTDPQGNEALPVFPSQSVTLETDSPFAVKNPNAGAISYVVGQVFLRGVTVGKGGAAGAPASGGGGSSSGVGEYSGGGSGSGFGGRYQQP